MSLRHIRSDMNKTRVISNESLDYCSQNYSFLFDRDANLDTSLSDICDTISLYDYDQNDDSKNSKRLTWEEWYLKKKIEKLENEKKMQIAIEKVNFCQ
ncbi:unnamed protein product [Brachionus calyciflorus]|uniref:Uncharacterized protein n=1 Tax=Brachionus calyciflorus TaxID=104777 RepID=A0A813QSL2_9BILA|nr:unnamed protein product [Brachionus calyciflorus]